MAPIIAFTPAPLTSARAETGPARVVAFPTIVSDRRWLTREAHRVRAGVSGATYRSIADTVRRRLIAAGLSAADAEAEARAACEFVQTRVNLFHAIDDTGLSSSGLPPHGGRRA